MSFVLPLAASRLVSVSKRRIAPKILDFMGAVAELVENRSGVISGLNFPKPNRRLAAADGDNANVDEYSKCADW
jgi:hypothetical protein